MDAMSDVSADVLSFEKELSGKIPFTKQAEDLQKQAEHDDMHEKENPLSEEHLRLELHNNDPDKMKLDHSYYTQKGYNFCRVCKMNLVSLEDQVANFPLTQSLTKRMVKLGSEQTPNEFMYGDPAVFGNGETYAFGLSGNQRIGWFLRQLAKRLSIGSSERELEAIILRNGFVNRVAEYIEAARKIYNDDIMRQIKESKESKSLVEKKENNKGQTR